MENVKEVDPQGMLEDALISQRQRVTLRENERLPSKAPEEWSDHHKTGIQINI